MGDPSSGSAGIGVETSMHVAVAARYPINPQCLLLLVQGTSVRRAATQQMSVAALGHPAGASEMAFPSTLCSIWFVGRIDVKNDPGDFAPVCPFRSGVEQAKISYEMLFIISGQDTLSGRKIGDEGIEWWRLHRQVHHIIGVNVS
jgi:hypothetical protein